MSDLIERLRDFADGPRIEGMPIAADAMIEAADELTALRDALDALWSDVHGSSLRLSASPETIAKVRAVLAKQEASHEG